MITYCNTYCRSNLCNYTYFGSASASQTLSILCLDGNSTCRTVYTALTAVYTLCLCNFFIKCRHNHSFCSTECKSKCTDSLNFLAGTYTVTTQNTFVWITYHRWRTGIQLMLFSCILKRISYAEPVCQFLKTHSPLLIQVVQSRQCAAKAIVPQSVYDIFSLSCIGIDYHSISRLF